MSNDLQVFFVKFFGSLKCRVKSDSNTLIIEDVPQKFEKFSGKRGPYYFAFHEPKEGYELINSTHYLIKTIKDFLEGSGETAILKISFKNNLQEEIPKIIPFRNSEIKSITKFEKMDFIFKFSFSTIFQYLNERENIITNIYIYDNKIIELDESLQLIEGNKRDVGEINLEKEYEFARTKLKEFIHPKVEELSLKLNSKLKEEIARIKSHYEVDLKEFIEQETSLKKQIESNKDDFEKVKKIEKSLQNLREEKNIDKLRQEEKTFTENEIKKHGLSINTRLINTAIIYFPIYNLNLVLELENKKKKIIGMTYDPFRKKLSQMFCQTCKKELEEIIICASGHITCRECGDRCENCGEVVCKSCNENKCSHCGKNICAKCSNHCTKCKKNFCENHLHKIPNSEKKYCGDCIERCGECGLIVDPELTTRINQKMICLNCAKRKANENVKDLLR